MAEISGTDVEDFTGGRLDGNDDQVLNMLAAALISARRYLGWHVSPIRVNDEIVLDGPDSRILMLPTRKLVELTSVEENGTLIDLTKLRWSVGGAPGLSEPVRVRKKSSGWWTCNYQGITVVMTHGYTEAEAADWRWAILSMVDQMSMVTVGSVGRVSDAGLTRKTVDDVTYAWAAPYMAAAEDALYSVSHILDDYCLPRLEFL